jgi:hypothetical protein
MTPACFWGWWIAIFEMMLFTRLRRGEMGISVE